MSASRVQVGLGALSLLAVLACPFFARTALGMQEPHRPPGTIPLPKGVIQPLDRPQLRFLENLGYRSEAYSNEINYHDDSTTIYPAWNYASPERPQAIAHGFKIALKGKPDWKLYFPSMQQPYAGHAIHTSNGRPDLELNFDYAGANEACFLTVTDLSVVLYHYEPPEVGPPPKSIAPNELAKLRDEVKAERADVPAIGQAAGITLGVTTLEELRRAFGKGATMGGKSSMSPNGNQMWYDATTDTFIEADGGFKSPRGYIVESLNLDLGMGGDRSAPAKILLPKTGLGLLDVLHAGMTRREVEQALHAKLDPMGLIRRRGLVDFPGGLKSRFGGRLHSFARWGAWCIFDGDGDTLSGLMLNAGP
ncbi:MAG TPA: hypothetical protein VMI31_15235 [Fimbriimonadaceae bacterium]|nr:hypothetical protein [Fimbriimonadaceae bacterium]